mmetsp:Transcript_41687/g.89507  ORF Transcript_41687/g.89507 Transcript_41687/m.89507 type:complete len:441 (+) Transcript_41687:136-1458(+)|eukprot:CAMPEP_0206459834 /NCGR_PEP_ID=MMETSP0324_2-20121206/24407_1 /ASSEMBLY_ACC=CAM_ASM_000836 /TAXON_ID=2866 /ORGANISM="Crypthecodinium cohnii, Strain Seligo" /LENGTH=440 /DNA_ID=CAMNT_0053931451 /DNA_START=85 /DNA_END=1407 /DNA_ORIENTATION=+
MDFDELDDLAPVVENQQPATGSVLPLAQRSNKVPGLRTHLHLLSESLQKQLPPSLLGQLQKNERQEPTAKVRLICIHGVADSYKQDWFRLEADAPAEVEVLIYEFSGHGHRDREPVPSTIRDITDDAFDALREAMSTGHFALLGHSIGCLVVVELAKRAQAELNVKPAAVFMVERGACQWPLFTQHGLDSLSDTYYTINLNLDLPAEDRTIDLREKTIDGNKQESLLLVNSIGGVLKHWNDQHPDEVVKPLDEISHVGGNDASAANMKCKIDEAFSSGAKELRVNLRRRPYEFLKVHQPNFYKMFGNGPTRALDRWSRTWRCENDVLNVGYFSFECPFAAIAASASVADPVKTQELCLEAKAVVDSGARIYNKEFGDGTAFLGHFPLDTYDDWKDWTENKDSFRVVVCSNCDHMSIKASQELKDVVFSTLTDLVKLWSAR